MALDPVTDGRVFGQASRRARDGMLVLLIAPPAVGVLSLASSKLADVLATAAMAAGWLLVVLGLHALERPARARGAVGWWEAAVVLWVAVASLTVLARALEAADLVGPASLPDISPMSDPVDTGEGGDWVAVFAVTSAVAAVALLATSRLLLELTKGWAQVRTTWQTSFDLVRWLLLPGTALAIATMAWLQFGGGAGSPTAGLFGATMLAVSVATFIPDVHVIVSMHRTMTHATGAEDGRGRTSLHAPPAGTPTFDSALEGFESPRREQAARGDR